MSGSRPTLQELREKAGPIKPVFTRVTLATEVLVVGESVDEARRQAVIRAKPENWKAANGELLPQSIVLNTRWEDTPVLFTSRMETAYPELKECTPMEIIQHLEAEKPQRCPYTLDLFDDSSTSAMQT